VKGLRVLCAILAAAASAGRSAAALDCAVGGSFTADFAVDASRSFEDYASFAGKPALSLSADLWEARFSASLSGITDPGKAEFSLEEAYVRAWLGDCLSATVGWVPKAGLAAEVFPLTAFLGPSDPLSRLSSGGGSASRKSEPSIEIKAAASWWRASFECAPFVPALALPDLDSPWFPRAFVTSSYSFSGYTYELLGFEYWAAAIPRGGISLSPSCIARVGASLGPVELDLEYFHGLERQAVLFGALSNEEILSDYRVYIEPHRGVVDSLALAATAVGQSWRSWVEGSFTFGASLATGSVDIVDRTYARDGVYFDLDGASPFTSVPPCVARDRIACTTGASWAPDLSPLGLRILAEATWSLFLNAPEGCPVPTLSRAAAVGVEVMRIAGRIGVSASGIASLADWSAALRPSASLDLGGEKRLELSTLLFLGAPDSELGAYSGRHYIVLSFTQSY
jgi:hypothetical protein